MAELAAKLVGFSIMVAGIGEQDDDKQIDKGEAGCQKYQFPNLDKVFRNGEFLTQVFMGEQTDLLLAFENKEPEKNKNEPENESRGNEHVEDKAEVIDCEVSPKSSQ